MEIFINQQPRVFTEEELTLQQVLDSELPHTQKGVAVAVNGTVIPKLKWMETTLHSQDDVLIIKATQGG